MIRTKFDVAPFTKTVQQVAKYYTDVVSTLNAAIPIINRGIANDVVSTAYQYFDSMAASGNGIEHMYEFGHAGDPSMRLYRITQQAGAAGTVLSYEFIEARVPTPDSDKVFRDKARIMEQGVSVTIRPVDATILAFNVGGEDVFTRGPVITTPGKNVAGNFSNMFNDYMQYVAPNTIRRSVNKINRFYNVKASSSTLTGGRAAALRDIAGAFQ